MSARGKELRKKTTKNRDASKDETNTAPLTPASESA